MKLDELVKQISAAYGDALRSIVLYGSAATGERVADSKVGAKSDHNVLVIVREIPRARTRELAAAMRAWRDAGNPPPMTFTESEWRSSADVFPMEYADMIERHKLLAGEDPFAGISVARRDLRLQTEHETLALVLRLRSAVLLAGDSSKDLRNVMERSVSSALIVLRALIRLHGAEPPRGALETIRAASGATSLDLAPLAAVAAHVHGGKSIPDDSMSESAAAYLSCMERVTAHVDALSITDQ